MLKVGLTGGIGCGKSTVTAIFEDLQVPVLDADNIAHQLVQTGQAALNEISLVFGADILNPDGSLNRAKLKALIFFDLRQKQKLESILHPLVYKTLEQELLQLSAPYCIISIPLLFETNMTQFVDRILVIDCPVDLQIERVRHRDNLTIKAIQSIIDQQVSQAYRREKADDLIDNSRTDYRLAEQVKKLHNLYLSLSACQD